MSIENLLSKEDLSLQAEQYIHHRLRGKPYDPELSGCVVQIVSGNNPFRICDQSNYIDVSDPTVINSQLKAANKNINWHTMRGALICLRKWGFSSTYDAVNDRLKFDIVIHEVECIQTSPSDYPVIPETVSLVEAGHLKNKFNRLKKFHIAEELNESHPIETALEEIERERVNASEMTRFADHGNRRPQSIDASQESKTNNYFWTYEMPPNRQNQGEGQNFSATQPVHEVQSSLQDYNKHHYASLPENKDPFAFSEKFPSMVDPFKSQVIEEEDEFNDYLAELEGGEISSKKPIHKDQIEIEEVTVEKFVEKEIIVPGKRKAIDVLNKKKESLNDPLSVGQKKVFRGSMMDNISEQQKLIQARGSRSATKQGFETDLLNLLNAPESQESKRRSAPTQERTLKPSLRKEKVAPVYNLNEFVDISASQPYSQILRVDNKPKADQYQEIPRARNTRVTVEQQNANHYIFRSSDQEDIVEINNKEFFRSFKLIKFGNSPAKEQKQVSFINDNIRSGGYQKASPINKTHQENRPVAKQASPSPNKSRSRAENLTPSKMVENPLNKMANVDLSEFKLIQFKPSSGKTGFKK